MADRMIESSPHEVVLCPACSAITPGAGDHDDPRGGTCFTRARVRAKFVEDLGVESKLTFPHPDGGWPEIRITRVYMVHSDDYHVVNEERIRLVREESERDV